ncbi:methionine--tRNA ligase subunit beta, partial [Peptoniphilus sp. BV3C26]
LEDFEKLDLRVATIESVEDHPNADKLYILNLKLGQEKRTIVSGIKDYYKKDDLIGKQIIIVANLKPIKLRGVESKGMLLAAKDKNGNLSLASLMDKIEDGVSLG